MEEDLITKRTVRPSTWKLVLAIWAPVIILAAAYGTVYLVSNNRANAALSKQQSDYAACTAALANQTPSDEGEETCQVINGSIVHGFLGFPKYVD